MNFSSRVVNAAASKNQPVSFLETTPAQLNSLECALFGREASSVSMIDHFTVESSVNAEPAKMVFDNKFQCQSGVEKKFRKEKYERKHTNKRSEQKNKKRCRPKNDINSHFTVSEWRCSKDSVANEQLKSKNFEVLEPHFGLEDFDVSSFVIDTLASRAGITCSDDILREIEGLTALITNLCDCKSMKGMMAAVFLYVRTKFSLSVSSILYSYVEECFGQNSQAGEEKYCEPEWIRLMKDVRTRWVSCQSNGVFSNFCKLLSVLTVAGVASVSDLTFSLGKYKIIEPNLRLITGSASDLISAVCDIVIYFTEKCYQSWTMSSFTPFFTDSIESAELEIEYNHMLNYWDLYRNGNLTKIANVSEHDFLRRLEVMGDKLKTLISSLKGFDKKIIEDKYRMVTKIISQFNMIKVNSGFKRAPFSIEYFGSSSVGKSTVSEQISHYLFTSCGLSTDDGRKYTHISGKKHWDGARSDMLELKLDDHANTKAEFTESSPCDVIIKVCNNVPYSPPMADLNEKGKVWVEPELVSLTTNVRDLDARVYSNCPYSVQRRMHYVVEVTVKPEFVERTNDSTTGLDSAKAIEHYTVDGAYAPPQYHDLWKINLFRAVPGKSETTSGGYVPVIVDGKELRDLTLVEAANFLCDRFHAHRDRQFNLYNSSKDKDDSIIVCGVDGCKHVKGFCSQHPVEQFGIEQCFDYLRQELDDRTSSLLRDARRFYTLFDWLPYLPESLLTTRLFSLIFGYFHRYELLDHYRNCTILNCVFHVFCLVICIWNSNCNYNCVSGVIVVLSFVLFQYLMISFVKERYFDILRRRHIMSDIQRRWHDNIVTTVCSSAVLLGSFYLLSKAWKVFKRVNPHGSLEPTSQEQIDARDGEVNVWTDVLKRNLPVAEMSKCTTIDRLSNTVCKNLLYGSVRIDDFRNARMNALMLTSNVMLVPYHYFQKYGENLNCTFRKCNPETSGGKFVARVSLSHSYFIPHTDLVVCYVSSGGSFKNIVEYFPTGKMPSVPFRLYWRSKEGSITEGRGLTVPGKATTCTTFEGGAYKNLTINTFGGLCGAPLLAEVVGPCILGVHLGGVDGTPRGCYGALLQSQILDGIAHIRKCEGTIVSGGAENFPTVILGKSILSGADLHKKSPLNYMPPHSQVEYYGSCPGRSVFMSDVKVTPISEHIVDVCDVPNIYGPPEMKPEWKGWQDCLANLAVPAHPFPNELLSVAVRDYKEDLLPVFESDLWNGIVPLTDHDNLCGIPGKKFLDAIKLNTSIGYPLSGPKRHFVTELESTEDKPNNRVLDQVILDEIQRCEDCYHRGERAYPIAKACKKDEILAKKKCRIFYGNAISLTYLIRKYYLPILRVLQMNPLKSECAVGINSHGPEWQEFHDHVTKFGMDRLFGGDYGKYDQKLPSQLIFASLRILIDFARKCNYSQEDLDVMEAMTGDIVYAIIAYNGDLIGLTEGTHISGNSLTVVINGICGSLNLRCFFYSQYPCVDFDSRKKFRDCVAAMTYGDDNIGSVRPGYDEFNIRDCSKFLAKYGQVYTMPDKESELLKFLPAEEFEFLKRSSVYHPSLGVHVGALLDKSIYKSLHCFMRSKGSPETEEGAAALNIDTALREWFNHGEEKYEKQRKLMKEVASRAGISHMCTRLDVSYADVVLEWREKYGDDHRMFDYPDALFEVMDVQCGIEPPLDVNDHCIGTAANPFFFWEIWCAYASFIFYPILWYLLLTGKVTVTCRGCDKRWLYFLLFTTGGFEKWQNILHLVIYTLYMHYCVLGCKWYLSLF